MTLGSRRAFLRGIATAAADLVLEVVPTSAGQSASAQRRVTKPFVIDVHVHMSDMVSGASTDMLATHVYS